MLNSNVFPVLTELEWQLPMYLTSAGGWVNQERIDRPNGFDAYQWLQCIEGRGRLEFGGTGEGSADVSAGQGMLLYPHTPHRYYALEEPWTVVWVTFRGSAVPEVLEKLQLREGVYTAAEPEALRVGVEEAAEVLAGGDPFRGYEGSALLYRLLLGLARSASFQGRGSRQQRMASVEPMLRLIESRYAEDLELSDIAAALGVSPQYACMLFRRSLGMRPFEYVAKFRLRKAKEMLLSDGGLSVAEVGRRVGYPNTSYFIKQFKRSEGVTPTEFRRQFLG